MRSRKLAQLLASEAPTEEFVRLAKWYQSRDKGSRRLEDFISHCEHLDFGRSRENVVELADPRNWSPDVRRKGKKPRIALKLRVNQRNNLTMSHNSSWDHIVFPEDFSRAFWAQQGIRGWHASPDPCNLLWFPEFGGLCYLARSTHNPVAQSVLAGLYVSIKEIVDEVAEKLTLVASSTYKLATEGGQVTDLSIEDGEEMRRLEEEMRYRD